MSRYANLTSRPGNSSWFLQKTNDGHEMTMQHPFMKSIYAKNYDRSAYAAYLWSQYRIFAELEAAVVPLQEDPCLAPVYDERLHRSGALEADLRHWLGGVRLPSDARYAKMRALADEYVKDVQREAGDAKALLCHHFLHYNAVLSGGQFLSGQICAVESIDINKDPTGVYFYVFSEFKNTAARVQRYLKSMDSIALSDEDRDRMLPIMRRVYANMEKIFDAAHEIAPRDGKAYEEMKVKKLDGPAKEDLRLTLTALRRFDGLNGSRILLSLQGKLIDVTCGAEFYGPGGAYHLFAGRDATKCLATMDLNEAHLDDLDYVPTSEDAKETLESWLSNFTAKYSIVGELVKPMHLTPSALRKFDGQNGSRILLALQGKLIDVTSGAESYGPGGSYHLFAGHDVTRCLAMMDLSEASLDDFDFVPETEDSKKSLASWHNRLTAKYNVVGELVKPLELTLSELRAFDGKAGGKILVSLSGKIIDVSEGAASYGPGGAYGLFAGRDVTKNLALMDLSEASLDHPHFVPESDDAKKSLESWWQRLTSKYPQVGEVVGIDLSERLNSKL